MSTLRRMIQRTARDIGRGLVVGLAGLASAPIVLWLVLGCCVLVSAR